MASVKTSGSLYLMDVAAVRRFAYDTSQEFLEEETVDET